MDNYDVVKIVKKHLSKEFNCTENDFDSYKIVVTELKESGNKAMKAACFGGSAIFSVLPKMVPDFKRIFEGKNPDWIFETNSLIMLAEILYLHGHTIDDMYQYSVPDFNLPKTEAKYDIEVIESGFDKFKSEPLAAEVFDLESHGPIVLMLRAKKNGKTRSKRLLFASTAPPATASPAEISRCISRRPSTKNPIWAFSSAPSTTWQGSWTASKCSATISSTTFPTNSRLPSYPSRDLPASCRQEGFRTRRYGST